MKTGLGIYRKIRTANAWWNLLRFLWRRWLLGFDVANDFLKRTDKNSVQLILQKNGARIGLNCSIETGITFHNCRDYKNLIVGGNCHIGKNCFIDLKEKVFIGEKAVISMGVSIITHLDVYRSGLKRQYPSIRAGVVIKNDAYIGANVTLLHGVTVNEMSIVAANSLVKNDVPAFTLVGGVPAKIIKRMTDKE